jgi:hypothetical protein
VPPQGFDLAAEPFALGLGGHGSMLGGRGTTPLGLSLGRGKSSPNPSGGLSVFRILASFVEIMGPTPRTSYCTYGCGEDSRAIIYKSLSHLYLLSKRGFG